MEPGILIAPRARNRAQRPATLKPFAEAWLKDRQLKPRTVAFYEALLEQKTYPELGDVPLKDIRPHVVRNWYSTLDAEHWRFDINTSQRAEMPSLRADFRNWPSNLSSS
jgi:Phage integrase, N-terminal SAM-like domain